MIKKLSTGLQAYKPQRQHYTYCTLLAKEHQNWCHLVTILYFMMSGFQKFSITNNWQRMSTYCCLVHLYITCTFSLKGMCINTKLWHKQNFTWHRQIMLCFSLCSPSEMVFAACSTVRRKNFHRSCMDLLFAIQFSNLWAS